MHATEEMTAELCIRLVYESRLSPKGPFTQIEERRMRVSAVQSNSLEAMKPFTQCSDPRVRVNGP